MGFLSGMKAQKALMAHNKGNTEEALRLYREAYNEGMDKARFLLPFSILLLRLGEYEEAISYLSRFKTKDIILSSIALGGIGDAYAQLGESDKAVSF